jgi:cell division protein FtsZ
MIPNDNVSNVISAVFDEAVDPRITVVGVGGAGGNVVGALYDSDLNGVETVAVNTDPAGLTKTAADVKILLKPADREDAAEAAEEGAHDALDALRDSLSTDIVFVVAGLGGGAGTGAAPVVAATSKELGAVTVSIAILPFSIEGRDARARAGLERLRNACDSVIVVDNNSLARYKDLTVREAFGVVNRMVQAVIQGVLDHLARSFLTTVTEEVETVAREIEEEPAPVAVHVTAPPTSVQAAWETQPVTFDERGYIGYR